MHVRRRFAPVYEHITITYTIHIYIWSHRHLARPCKVCSSRFCRFAAGIVLDRTLGTSDNAVRFRGKVFDRIRHSVSDGACNDAGLLVDHMFNITAIESRHEEKSGQTLQLVSLSRF